MVYLAIERQPYLLWRWCVMKWLVLIFACMVATLASSAQAINFSHKQNANHSQTIQGHEWRAVTLAPLSVPSGFQSRTVFSPEKVVVPVVLVDGVSLSFIAYAGNLVDFVGHGVTVRMKAPQNRSSAITIVVSSVRGREANVKIGFQWRGSPDVPYGV